MKATNGKRSLRVGLTGSIGAGKSLALREFARLGAEAISTDAIAHDLSKPGRPGYRRIVRAFGRSILDPDGALSRRRLAEKVFKRPAQRRRLERLLHPLILGEMRRRLRASARPVAVADVPLLFEAGLAKDFDLTLLVAAPQALRLRRVAARDKMAPREARARMAAQWPEDKKRRLCDVVIPNAGTPKDFSRRIRGYYKGLELMTGSRTEPRR